MTALLHLLGEHWALTVLLCLMLAAVLGGGAAVLATSRRDEPTGRHGRPSGVYHGKPTEIRRHRPTGDRAWPGTITVAVRAEPVAHRADEAAARHHAANRYEDTGEITRADLEALLGPRPGNEPTVERPQLVTA